MFVLGSSQRLPLAVLTNSAVFEADCNLLEQQCGTLKTLGPLLLQRPVSTVDCHRTRPLRSAFRLPSQTVLAARQDVQTGLVWFHRRLAGFDFFAFFVLVAVCFPALRLHALIKEGKPSLASRRQRRNDGHGGTTPGNEEAAGLAAEDRPEAVTSDVAVSDRSC